VLLLTDPIVLVYELDETSAPEDELRT